MAARVLIAGAGVAALEAALGFQALAGAEVEVELLGAEHHFWYRPLAVGEAFDLGEATRYELPALAAAAGAVFTRGELRAVDDGRGVADTTVGEVRYDYLLIAVGATPVSAVPGGLTFRGPADTDQLRSLLAELAAGKVRRVAFVAPTRVTWTLPLYELALLTANHVAAEHIEDVELTVVTPEPEPLGLYGRRASLDVRLALEQHGVRLRTAATPLEHRDGVLRVAPLGNVEADRVIALPRLRGATLEGVPQTAAGFIQIDAHAQVRGLDRAYAAGDIVDFPVKHGGIAAQLADAAASSIAARAGAPVEPEPFRPALEAVLLTGDKAHLLPPRPGGGADTALSWSPAKIVSRYLSPFLARFPTDLEP
jgi:sulfide:quinone oxidoreductase